MMPAMFPEYVLLATATGADSISEMVSAMELPYDELVLLSEIRSQYKQAEAEFERRVGKYYEDKRRR